MPEQPATQEPTLAPSLANGEVQHGGLPIQPQEEPIRGDHFSLDQLEEHARRVAAAHTLGRHRPGERHFLPRFEENSRFLTAAYQAIGQVVRQGRTITPDAEWLIDNFYVVQEQLREIRQDLPRRYFLELPKLATGPLAGNPRVYALALELIAHTDSALDQEALLRFVHAYQEVAPLTIGEVWAVPIMLRLGMVENLRRLAAQMLHTQEERAHADRLAEGLLNRPPQQTPEGVLANFGHLCLSPACVVQAVERVRDHGQEAAVCVHWIEQRLEGRRIDDIIRIEHQRQAANQVSISNIITSMRLMSNLDWQVFFERTSLSEQVLRQDPAGIYKRMEFATRDMYRHRVEELSKRTRLPEVEVCSRLVEVARQADPTDSRRFHIGYYLIGKGQAQLEKVVGFRPRIHEGFQRRLVGHPTLVYLGSIFLVMALELAGLLWWVRAAGGSVWQLILAGVLALLPASELAVSLVNCLVTALMRPRVLPKMDFQTGVPQDYRTMVVIPTMLSSDEGVRHLLERLEIHYLANPEEGLAFALLTDFVDASEQHLPEDEHLVEQAVAGIRELNARYPAAEKERFFLFHRARRWNPAEAKWMGWERKRGKLLEFNRLLRGATDTGYVVQEGDWRRLGHIRFIITLDTDTQLPRGAARRLAGTLAHPLNEPRFDPQGCRVVEGYAVLQPRVTVSLASAHRSLFARIFSGAPGLDPYTTAVSDVYQDLFREGSFTGKGIYDVDTFEAATGATFPENHILSHDLIEGCHARVGLVSDVEFLDEFPAKYHAYARRQHRWVRGDWQLLPWLFRRVPTAGGVRPNPLTVLSRWKVFDNMRRSLVMPALLLLLAVGWLLLPGPAWVWTLAGLVIFVFPILAYFGLTLFFRPKVLFQVSSWRDMWRDLRSPVGQLFLMTAFLPHQAYQMTDAILRTLARLFWTRRRLLEWETASATERRLGLKAWAFITDMWFAPVAALVVWALLPVSAYGVALPLLVLWLLSPLIAFWVSRPAHREDLPLSAAERQTLRRIARKTWSFFERFVTEEDNWLPPDNFQEQPREDIAHRISPTNEGLLVSSALAAHDFGYLGLHDLIELLEKNLASWEKLERYRGHFFNWYDTQTLEVLRPRYVSTVDSGNLAACFLTTKQGLLERIDVPLLDERWSAGLTDTARLVREALDRMHPPGARLVSPSLDQLEKGVDQVLVRLQRSPRSWTEYFPFWQELEAATAGLLEHFHQFQTEIPVKAEELVFRLQSLANQVGGLRKDDQALWPWAGPQVSAEGFEGFKLEGEAARRWQALWTTFHRAGTLQALADLEKTSETAFALLQETLNASSNGQGQEGLTRLSKLREAVQTGSRAAGDLIRRLQRLAERYETLALEIDFTVLYDPNRKLFAIGYNSEDGRLDRIYYDLLASEARLASFLAIATGKIDQRHWFHLGRQLTNAAGTKALLSWAGTMFEYLMPVLFTRTYLDTLLDLSCKASVDRQIEYGRQQQVPWGISESAYGAVSVTLHYQYQSFGVPGLGLKRGLAKDLVISPYSTALAVMVRPREAVRNFQDLEREGAEGVWGFYDALDYTADRVPSGQRCQVVRCYMVHHQGMSLLALANTLFQNCMQRRFHDQPLVRSTELLFQERVPMAVPVFQPHGDEVAAVHLVREAVRPVSRRLTTPDTPAPRTHLLSNREHTVMVTNAGTGFSQCRGTLLTRWRPDSTRDPWGHFLYVRDGRSGLLWSAGFQPVRKWPDRYEVIFSSDRAEIRRWDGEVETHLQITVSPEDNTEIRQLTVTNHGKRPREIEVTTYAELALAPYGADLAHPAFNKLFIQTEALPDGHGLLATRRARDAKQEPVWLAYVLAVDQPLAAPVTYETDRARFLGRGRTPANPAALDPNVALSGTTGAVLDPILSLRCLVRLRPGQSAQLAFNLAVARSREEALMLADRFHDPRVVLRTLELAWAHSQVELRHHQLSPGEAHLFQRLASPLFYPDPSRRAPAPVLAANRQGQAYLWRYGISGDYPLVLVRLTNPGQIALIREVLLAHEFWRSKGLIAELVILNDQPASYLDQVTEQLHGLIQGISSRDLMDKRGGIFLLRGTQVPEADRVLLQAAASVYLHGERGPLARQVEQALPPVNLPGRLPLKISEPQPAAAAVPPPPLPPLFANGLGGFSADGREYVINLAPGQWTPAPWSNVIANPHFGFLISEAGGGYTWSENSRENKLTPWANDPVADTPGEVVYLRDEETGELWSPTPLPMGGSATFTVHHGQGYTRFEHQSHGLAQQLLYSLPPADSVKFLCLRLRNLSNRTRKLSATFYVEWVLGVARDQTQLHVVTEADDQTGALLARNGYNQDFGNRVAFLTILGRPQTVTGDRTEFLGRNGGYDRPAALARVELSDRLGPGFDPCGAVQTKLELPPGQVTEVIFLLGQEGNLPAVHHLLERYRTPEAVHAAIAQTQAFWENLLNTVQVKTPDQALDLLLNRWLLYQVLSCRLWGRSALYQSGGAYGFRDQLQDVMALVYGAPQLTRAQILRSAARQFEEGDVQHWWHPPVNRGIRTRFSDDYLFLPFVTCHYLRSTGDRAILEERLPFLHSPLLEPHEEERYELPEVSPQVDTLYQHCLRAIDHGFRFGVHGLPLMGCGDWNDGMNKVGAGGQGESVWVAWFLVTILDQFAPLVEERGDSERAAIYRAKAVQLRQAIDEQAWDGQWYRRAYYDDGTPLGSAANEECRIDSLVQSWAVIAGGNPERARQAMAAVDEYLVKREERLLLLFTPPFDQTPHDPGYIKGYLPGVRENGGQYTHAALWVVQAFALLGDGDKAWELLNLLNPIHHGDSERVEAVYKVEPYVIAADVYSRRPHTGRGGWTWYTGSAGWVYRVALESLLGFQLHGHRLRLEPCIPAAWPGFELTYHHGQTVYRIVVDNPEHVQHGVGEVLLDGKVLPDGEVLLTEDGGTHEVRVRMGEKKDHGSHG